MAKRKDITRAIAKVILPPLGYLLMRFYWYTSRKSFHIEGEVTQDPGVIVCWHGELLLSPQAYRHFHKKQSASGIISRHFDGEMIARVLEYFYITPLRGSSSRGAKQVLLEAFRALKKGDDLLVTPDGPRGPRHEVSDGAVALAVKGKLPIYAVNFTCKRYWQLGSWDRFVVPKPFSTIDFHIKVLQMDGMELDEAKAYLTDKMLEHTII
ncbi:lysophospholipid acyltransferase family protein [Sulfurovum mangrovi]|uniref:lysophospholipid acyltransferase family protein n=1 Tax=Sulfurovum mangrovi TaxID=2893889 RepID=UPI001E548A41|nr:lysophospholipid acyltransferase family protein [Sulfurovum mangrovi]UFH59047.1 lysophospholipid acyltransferase family protein [Sulfurovum mangrovi]